MKELAVFVDCRDVVLGLSARYVERLVLAAEARALTPREPAGATGRKSRPLVEVGGKVYVAWDLASMLGLQPTTRSWLLLRVPYGSEVLPLALRTGVCLAVRELGALTPLPSAMFTLRSPALTRAFALDQVAPRHGRSVGLFIDLPRLWAEGELAASAAALSGAMAP